MSEKVDRDQPTRNAELAQLVADAKQARARFLDLVSYIDDYLEYVAMYPDAAKLDGAITGLAREAVELAQLVWDHKMGVKGKHSTVTHKVWRTIELLEMGRHWREHAPPRHITGHARQEALLRGEDGADVPLSVEQALDFAVSTIVDLARGSRDGLAEISPEAWRRALERWRGFVAGTSGVHVYSWHSVVADLLKPIGITTADKSNSLIKLMKDAGHVPR